MFRDRSEAGKRLAKELIKYKTEKPLILALPRGGVPVGYEVAKSLEAPLDVFVVRKVGAPWNPEFGVGAVALGVEVLDKRALQMYGIRVSDLKDIIELEQEEVERRNQLYRQDQPFPILKDQTIILVDDGIATGVTTRAAIQAIKKFKPAKLILAVPVGPRETVYKLQEEVDAVICLESPLDFYAVSAFYDRFPQTSDEEVIALLEKAREEKNG